LISVSDLLVLVLVDYNDGPGFRRYQAIIYMSKDKCERVLSAIV